MGTTIAQTHHVSSDILAFLAASIETGDTEDDHDTSEDCNEEFEDIWIAQAAAAFGGGDSGSRSSKTKHTRSEEGEDDNEESSQHVIHKDDHGKIIAFGVPAVPQTTMVSLKHNETRGADNEDAQTCSTRSCSSSEHSNANTSRTTSSSHRISFNEAVTVNQIENFRYILPKRERYSLWYSDIENIRMQIDYMNEKEQQTAQREWYNYPPCCSHRDYYHHFRHEEGQDEHAHEESKAEENGILSTRIICPHQEQSQKFNAEDL